MRHYPHHIGDFRSATRHLTTVERALYRECIDAYYDAEQPLQADDFDRLCKQLLARSDEEKQALRNVLDEFFLLVDGCYVNDRCDKEIVKYQSLISAASKAGKASAERRRNGKATTVERPLQNRTTNQEPRTKNQEPSNTAPDGFDDFWKTYPKKTAKPAAVRAFKAAKINGSLGDVLAHVVAMAASDDWTKSGGQFVPNPATYLNQRRWEDEMSTAEPERSWV